MDLPSEDWLELTDCWICHKDDTAHFYERIIKEGIQPMQGRLYNGTSHVMVHTDDMHMVHIQVKKKEVGEVGWKKTGAMSCAHRLIQMAL
jgi:hypothetical protein